MRRCCTASCNQFTNSQKSIRFRTSFFYKVLLSLKILQDQSGNSQGIKLCDVVKYMECSYSLSGDVYSQVQSSLSSAEDYHFVLRKKDKYILTTPAAMIQLTPNPCRKVEIERIQQIFNIASGSCASECPSSCSTIKPARKRRRRPCRSRARTSTSSRGRNRCRSRSRSRSRSPRRSRSRSRSPRRSPEDCRCPRKAQGILKSETGRSHGKEEPAKKKVKIENNCINLRTRNVPGVNPKKCPQKKSKCRVNKCPESDDASDSP